MKKTIATRKIELRFNTTNKEERGQAYRDFKAWRKMCYKGANHVVSNLFFMLNQGDMAFLTEKAKRKIEDKSFFKDMSEEEKEQFFTKENNEIYKIMAEQENELIVANTMQNAFYQVLSKKYLTEMPSSIITSLNQRVFKAFKENRPYYLAGDKSIPSYRKTIPIPIQASNILNVRRHVFDGKVTKNFDFTLFGRPIRTNFGMDKSNNAGILNMAFSSWFLPDWIWKLEAELSAILVTFPELKGEFVIKKHRFTVEAKMDEQKIDHYKLSTTDEDKTITFKMTQMKVTEKDEDGKPVLDEKGKKKKKVAYKIVSNVKLCDSSIVLEEDQAEDRVDGTKKDITRIFLLAVLEFDKEEWALDESQIAKAELSPDIPVKLSIGNKTIEIGSKDDFMYRRIGIEGARHRTQKDLTGNKGGNGRRKKLKPLEQYKDYERNVVIWKLHNYSRKLIKFCLENQCKYLHLCTTEQTDLEAKENPLLLRYWSKNGFIEYISYKADKAGIIVTQDP